MNSSLQSLLTEIVSKSKSTPKERPKAYSYLRFSTPEQRKGDSFRRQSERAIQYAESHGLQLDDSPTYHDLGKSGFRGANAETGKLAEFREGIRLGIIPSGSYLLVENLDRLSRQSARKALRTLEEIIEGGVTVVTLMDGREYTQEALDNDGISLLIALLTMMRAHEESRTKSDRASKEWKSKLSRIRQGARPNSAHPKWLRVGHEGRGWELIPERAAVLRRIFKMALRGKGVDAIAKTLNTEQVPTFDAPQWWPSYIGRLLSSRRVIGEHTPKQIVTTGGVTTREPLKAIAGYYPAAVPAKLFKEVQLLRAGRGAGSPLRGRHAAHPVSNIFGGLMRCPLCGGGVARSQKGTVAIGNLWAFMVCTAARMGKRTEEGKPFCQYRAVGYKRLEEAFISQFGNLYQGTPPVSKEAKFLSKQIENLERTINPLKDELENLLRMAARAKQTAPEALLRRIREVEAELKDWQGKRAELLARASNLDRTALDIRMEELSALVGACHAEEDRHKIDRTAINTVMRRIFSRVIMDYRNGCLRFVWRHAEDQETRLFYTFPDDGGD